MRRNVRAALIAALICAPVIAGAPAHAAFPGDTGDLAWSTRLPGDPAYQVHRMTSYGTGEVVLTSAASGSRQPDWSPDGSLIAFERAGNVWVMRADGTRQRRLTRGPAADRSPAWSPDGSRLAFVSNRGDRWGIFVMWADGRGVRRIADLRSGSGGALAWSPEGRRIAAVDRRAGGWNILVLYLRTGATDVLTDIAADGSGVDWSPDGKQLVYASDAAGDSDIYRMNADGTRVTHLTSGIHTDDTAPIWSPDGGRIFFVRKRDKGDTELFAMSASTGNPAAPLTSNSDPDVEPAAQSLCTIVGTPGPDSVRGTSGSDVICGLGGDDGISALGGDDVVFGGAGADVVRGGEGRDVLAGGRGRDRLLGAGGADLLNGRDGRRGDRIGGGSGSDACVFDRGDRTDSC